MPKSSYMKLSHVTSVTCTVHWFPFKASFDR